MPTFSPAPSPTNTLDKPAEENKSGKSAYEQKMNKDLEEELPKDIGDPTGPKISQAIADCLQKWFGTVHSGHDIQETFKKCIRPENATALKAVQHNSEVKKKLNRPEEIADQCLKWLCTATPKAAQPW